MLLPTAATATTKLMLLQRPPLPPSRLEQCLLLALLLHILLVLALGNTPGGTARPGEGVWGRLNITLRPSPEPGPNESGSGVPAPPEINIGKTGQAKQQRYGGTVRPEAAPRPPADTPGAAALGQWQERPQPSVEPAAVVEPSIEAAVDPPAALRSLAPQPGTRIERISPDALTTAPAPQAAAALDALPALPTLRPKRAPVELKPSLTAPLQPAPETLSALPAFEAPAPLAAPEPAPQPAPQPAAAPAPVPEAKAEAVPPPPAAAAATTTPAPPSPAPSPSPSREAAAATSQPSSSSSTTTPATAAPSSSPRPAPTGAPDAGARLGHDVATPASTPASAPRLNLNLPLPRGGPLSSRGSPGALPLLPHPPEQKSKLAEDIEKAASKDCRKAYSEMGLLAAVPLALDAARNKGCRW